MSKRNPTYYEILGIPSNAKHNDVGLAFNRKMRALKREDDAARPEGGGRPQGSVRDALRPGQARAVRRQASRRVLKPRFGRNHAAIAALFVVIVAVGLFWYLRPQLAPETVALETAGPGKPYQEVLNGAIPAVGRLQSVEMSGQAKHAGVAFTVEEGCRGHLVPGLSPTAQLKVDIPPRVIPARVTMTDDELGLCKLEVLGPGRGRSR
jgi:hypothetical protein